MIKQRSPEQFFTQSEIRTAMDYARKKLSEDYEASNNEYQRGFLDALICSQKLLTVVFRGEVDLHTNSTSIH